MCTMTCIINVCGLTVLLHSELLHQLLHIQQWTMAMTKLHWSYDTLLEPIFYSMWYICHSQCNGIKLNDYTITSKEMELPKHQQSQTRKMNGRSERSIAELTKLKVFSYKYSNLSLTVILQARVTVQWRNNLINKR